MHTCYLCQNLLTEDLKSSEHIFPNCIGGFLESSDLICKECNNSSGIVLDNNLCEVLGILSTKYPIKRKGKTPNFIGYRSDTNEKIKIEPGWNVRDLDVKDTFDGLNRTISVGDKKRLLEEIQKQRIDINDPNYIYEGPFEREEPGGLLSVDIHVTNHDLLMRSVSKICASYYLYAKGKQENIKSISNYIINGTENFYSWFLQLDLGKSKFPKNVYHILVIKGNKKEKCLYAYVEFYCSLGFIVLLNTRYSDNDISFTYAFDPITHKEIEFQFDSNYSIQQFIDHVIAKPGFIGIEAVEL